MAQRVFAAVDIGASGGRVMAGVVDAGRVELHEVHRFTNGCRPSDGHLRWDLTGLYEEVLIGLAKVPDAESIGIDTWAVDYGLLDERGQLLAEPIAYRDDRTAEAVEKVQSIIGLDELHRITGLQHLPFNTVFQLAAERDGPLWDRAAHVVLLPDVIAYWLTGELRTEATNASTTGLVDVHTGEWSSTILDRLGIDAARMPPIEVPGAIRGHHHGVAVTTVGSHDTASAVVGTPMTDRRAAYVACGTWSLVGLELDGPVVTDASRAANFTNELGVDGRVRFLRNVAGLFLLTEVLHHWRYTAVDRDRILTNAAGLPRGLVFDVDEPRLSTPGNMPGKICDVLQDAGWAPPRRKTVLVRAVLDSLAVKLAATAHEAARLSGRTLDVLHLVGGGVNNPVLCQLVADEAGLPVVAGPVEATAIGNLVVQARAAGTLSGTLEDLRGLVARTQQLVTYTPRGD